MTTPYRRGQSAQYRARDELRGEGFHTGIIGRSLGPFDLIAWNPLTVLFIQVKSCQAEKYYFPKTELENFINEKIPSCGEKEIWIWLKNRGWRKWKCSFSGNNWKLIEGQETFTKGEWEKIQKKENFPRPF